MAAIWTLARPEPSGELIKVGAPVSSRTWQNAAHLANFLRGKGACLVPWCFPDTSIGNGVTDTYRFQVRPRNVAISRVWCLLLSTTDTGAGSYATVQAPASGGTAVTTRVPRSPSDRKPFIYIEDLAAQSGVTAQIDISVTYSTTTVGATLRVEGIACYEQDRVVLAKNTTDYGIDVTTVAVGDPIYDGSYQSVGGLMDALENCDARRVGIWHWTRGNSVSASRKETAAANLLQLGVPGLARKLARAATTGSVKWSVYGKMSAAGTGTVRLTSTSGVNDAMSVTSTTDAWTTARTVSIDCDNFSASDGRQSSRWDDLQITLAGDGTNSTIVKSVSIWSDD